MRRPKAIEVGVLCGSTMRGPRPDGRWYWRARRRDNRETAWTGWATRDEAVEEIAALVTRGLPLPRSGLGGAAKTVGDLMRRWIDHQRERRKGGQIAARSLTNYEQAARYWSTAVGDVRSAKITRSLVEDTITAWQADGVAPRTCKFALDALAAAVRWGAARGHCVAVDLSRISTLTVRDDEFVNVSYTPTRSQAAAVIGKLAPGPVRDLVQLLALTGARISEIGALEVGDYDRDARTLRLTGRDDLRERRGKVKARQFPVAGELAAALERLTASRTDERIVLGLPWHLSDTVRHHLEVACDAAKVPRFSAHGLRRMVAMELLDAGIDARTVSELTGHSVAVLLRHYVRPTTAKLRDVVVRAGFAVDSERGKVIEFGDARGAQNPGTTGRGSR